MKRHKIIVFLVCFLAVSFVYSQNTAIPDINFEEYLETHAEDGTVVDVGDATSMGDGIANNGLVLTDRIDNILLLDVSNLGILDLTGIEDFTALETLICSGNSLPSIDVSNNISLITLLCGSNLLSDLVLTNNTNLETLNCSDNQIQSLVISNNTALKSLTASGNQLSTIDISSNTDLSLLGVSNNRITGELIVSNNTNLESLFCASNQIISLNLNSNTLLKDLDVSNNALTSLDLSTINTVVCPDPQTDPAIVCQGLASINVSRNELSSLVVNNGYNDLFSTFNASDNPELYCIQIDAGFTPSGWIKDDWTYYSENTCEDIYTYVPDDNFEQALIDQGYDDVLDNLVLTDNIDDLTSLVVSNASISSLIGIEDFLALEVLDSSENNIASVDLSSNTALLQLNISGNDLLDIDLSANTLLEQIDVSNNDLSILDISNNTVLSVLNCSQNTLSDLNVASNIQLSDLDCSNNQIENLEVTFNVNLTSLLCNDNSLFALNVDNGNNAAIITLDATNNTNLFCVKVSDLAYANGAIGWQKDAGAQYNGDCGTYIPDDNFEQYLINQNIDSDGVLNNFVPTTDIFDIDILNISNLSIADLTGIEDFTALVDLDVSNNALTSLDLEDNLLLEVLDCSMNSIEDLDLTSNNSLTSLFCSNNNLRALNIENGNNNNLTAFDATSNTTLFCINVDDAITGNIPAAWQKDDFASYNGDCANSRLTIIPDTFFEQSLIDLNYDDIIDGQVLTSNIEHIQNLDVSDKSISDLTGIQDFKSLIELSCSGNFLNDLDVSGMLFLERLNCSSNYFLTNDVSNTNGLLNTTGTISLKELYCSSNNLNDLDTSQNTNLELLDCADNNIASLNISNNALLRHLNCSNNDLTNLDISNNQALEDVSCNSNQISDLMTSGIINNTLTDLSCFNNNLSGLLVNNYQALETLNCGSNSLTQLNVDDNTTLNFLSITNNQISEINLINNINLVEVLVSQNSMSELNVSANILLEHLNCDFNELTELLLNSNPLLEFLSCSNNQLTELDIFNNDNLIEVNFSSNMISSLTLSSNLGVLKRLNVSNNLIEDDLDLTTMAISACVFQPNQTEFCPETISINVSNNLLNFINIQNGINADITSFNASGNPNLECIQVDDVDNVSASWIKDETTAYSEDCNFGETYVPDDNFEQALINLGYDSGPLNDYVLTANIEALTSLDVSGNTIADLTGIEDFVALENLNFSNNVVSELDLSSNTNLLSLDCSNNALTDLNVESNTVLTTINAASNAIISLNLNENTNLTGLNISNNGFTSFTPSEVLSLQVLNCDANQIIELNFQQNQSLTSISCQSNLLETLNIRNGQNAILSNLDAQNNPNLLCIETDNGAVPTGATWIIDTTAQFAINCFFGETYVPDDNFEQALIDLGLDSGVLDDYVFTENIEDLTFLNLSGREISDLTGIEDFISLTTLNFDENSISEVDLSNNTLLINLDASNNLLSEIDISFLSGLTNLNVSNNNLSQLSFDANLGLVDLDISINMFTNLNVDGLVDLEELNCASNQLSSLSVTQNPNLTLLFCQSNMFIADQLNIQNGNNENLQLFNAANNPDLGCILVDNPVAVIENTDGLYDNWIKDDSASYQTVCEDADNDGVPNEDDLCPSTEFGAAVDLFGCAIIDLPNDNFTVLITGETCLNSNNGKITIVAQELYNYTATLIGEDILDGTGEVFYQEYNFTNDVDIFNLLAGTYEMCITIEEWPDYESCYTIVITQPEPLEVFASRVVTGNAVSVDMFGSDRYNIEFNGELFTTHNTTLTLQLQQGINDLKVSTDLECQGTYEKRIFIGDDFLVYPNPFNNQLTIYNGIEDEEVTVNVYSSYGQLVLTKTMINHGTDMIIDTNSLTEGVYLISIHSQTMISTYKIIKK